jgi:N-acylneuraminate cytidylyltransferase
MKICALIPARGGSKGVSDKNIRLLNGKPLVVYSIEQALNSKYIDDVYVSSDSEIILNISKDSGAKIILRPEDISGDTATTESVIDHFLTKVDTDIVVLIQCTSPFRTDNCFDEAILELKRGFDSIISVSPTHKFRWKLDDTSIKPLYDYKNRPRRQDIIDVEFVETGSFYIFKKRVYLQQKNRLCGKIGYHIMPEQYSYEIDTENDFKLLEVLMVNK